MQDKEVRILSLIPTESLANAPRDPNWIGLMGSPPTNCRIAFELNLTPIDSWVYNFFQCLKTYKVEIFEGHTANVKEAKSEGKILYLMMDPRMWDLILERHLLTFRLHLENSFFKANKTRPSSVEEIHYLAEVQQAQFEAKLRGVSDQFLNVGTTNTP